MAADSKIEWTDHTFNSWIGCTKVSRAATGGGGCDNCYAEVSTPVRVLRGKGEETWGTGAPRVRTSAANWALPKRWNAQADAFFAQHGRRQRVFCASLADVFDNAVPASWRVDLFHLIAATPNLDWLLLTKRIGNARAMLDEVAGRVMGLPERTDWKPLPNVWLGATVVNQAEADRDIPKLLEVPAAKRFLSMEPLLGPVHLDPRLLALLEGCSQAGQRFIDWIIVGGESGPNARPMHPDWPRSIREQCQAAGVPFFFKQIGEWASAADRAFGTAPGEVRHIKADGSFWGDDLPQDEDADALTVVRVGKKAAGRLLDGREWNEVPA